LQTVAGGENQVIKIAQLCKEAFYRLLIGGINRLALCFSGNTPDRSLDLFRVTRSDGLCGRLFEAADCATASPMPDEPPSRTTRLLSNVFACCMCFLPMPPNLIYFPRWKAWSRPACSTQGGRKAPSVFLAPTLRPVRPVLTAFVDDLALPSSVLGPVLNSNQPPPPDTINFQDRLELANEFAAFVDSDNREALIQGKIFMTYRRDLTKLALQERRLRSQRKLADKARHHKLKLDLVSRPWLRFFTRRITDLDFDRWLAAFRADPKQQKAA
jgi:hypothetical protein